MSFCCSNHSISSEIAAKLCAEDASGERFINDDSVIDMTSSDDKLSNDSSLNIGKEDHPICTISTPLTKCSQPAIKDQPVDGVNVHFKEPQLLSSETPIDYANMISLMDFNDYQGERIDSIGEIQNDEYRYLTDAFQASEEYLINESSF